MHSTRQAAYGTMVETGELEIGHISTSFIFYCGGKHKIMQIYLRGKSRVFGRYKSGSWRSRGPDLSGQLQIRQSKGTHIHIWWCDVAKQVMSQDLGMSVV